jgi:hypothetical protein
MEYFLAIFLGGIVLSLLGMGFQKTIDQTISGKSLLRDFLVGLGVTAGIFYYYPDSLEKLNIPVGGGDASDLLLQVG